MTSSAGQRASRDTPTFQMWSFRMVPSPLPRLQECSGPDPAPGRFGFALLGAIMAGIAGGHRPPLPYDPRVDVGAVRHGAGGEDTVVPVDAVACACQFPATDIASQFLRRRLSARPHLPLGVDACLSQFGGIDPLQANARAGNFEAVAVQNPCPADQR